MSTPSLQVLDDATAMQAAMTPRPEDQNQWLVRFMFVPFRDKPLSPHYQQLYGITMLRQGIIQPFHRFDKPEPAYELHIRPDESGGLITSTPLSAENGVAMMRRDARSPKVVVDSLLREFAEQYGNKTGVVELESLRGNELDKAELRQMQLFFLPDIYPTYREQAAQLNAVDVKDAPESVALVHQELLDSTSTARNFALGHYRRLMRAVERFGNGDGWQGKDELSPLDIHVCQWLELPEPKLQTKLAGAGQDNGTAIAREIAAAIRDVQPAGVSAEQFAALQQQMEEMRAQMGQGVTTETFNPSNPFDESGLEKKIQEATQPRARKSLDDKQADARERNK